MLNSKFSFIFCLLLAHSSFGMSKNDLREIVNHHFHQTPGSCTNHSGEKKHPNFDGVWHGSCEYKSGGTGYDESKKFSGKITVDFAQSGCFANDINFSFETDDPKYKVHNFNKEYEIGETISKVSTSPTSFCCDTPHPAYLVTSFEKSEWTQDGQKLIFSYEFVLRDLVAWPEHNTSENPYKAKSSLELVDTKLRYKFESHTKYPDATFKIVQSCTFEKEQKKY